ncbi:unnamed protein product [Phytophthora fragariaefolia]|uniref:Unnamed protein product n=1 Tax=Phytophthora fragariaefolia TaxID=1490495 RepID=A0A9W7D0Q8_9STRA|nr:unnamed protein product [Phytophthora fragariaefolia]
MPHTVSITSKWDRQQNHLKTANQIQVEAQTWGPSSSSQVEREAVTPTETVSLQCHRIKLHELASGLYRWATCLFIVALVCSQLLGAVWDSITTTQHIQYGQSPLLGPFQIVGTNDVPYSDRVIACVRTGQYYEPKLVSALLAAPGESAILEDSTGTAVHGYRLRQRRVGEVTDTLDSAIYEVYDSSCKLIAQTIDNIFGACQALGYTNLTGDNLRVIEDWDSQDLYTLPNSLPVLIMPYWNNAPYARHAVPSWGGDACVFRLGDAYSITNTGSSPASFRGVTRAFVTNALLAG